MMYEGREIPGPKPLTDDQFAGVMARLIKAASDGDKIARDGCRAIALAMDGRLYRGETYTGDEEGALA